MANSMRLAKLKQAEDLIREVEFSYPQDSNIRRMLYSAVVQVFSFGGHVEHARALIKDADAQDKRGRDAKGETKRECPFTAKDFEFCPECRGSFNFMKPYGNACPHCGVNVLDAYEKSETV